MKNGFAIKIAESDTMEVPMICQKDKLPKLKKELSIIKLMASFKDVYQKFSCIHFYCHSMLHKVLLQQ